MYNGPIVPGMEFNRPANGDHLCKIVEVRPEKDFRLRWPNSADPENTTIWSEKSIRLELMPVRPTTKEGWEKFLFSEKQPNTGPKIMRAGQVWSGHSKSGAAFVVEVNYLIDASLWTVKTLAGQPKFDMAENVSARTAVLIFDVPEVAAVTEQMRATIAAQAKRLVEILPLTGVPAEKPELVCNTHGKLCEGIPVRRIIGKWLNKYTLCDAAYIQMELGTFPTPVEKFKPQRTIPGARVGQVSSVFGLNVGIFGGGNRR